MIIYNTHNVIILGLYYFNKLHKPIDTERAQTRHILSQAHHKPQYYYDRSLRSSVASIVVLVYSIILFRGGDSAEKIEQYVLQSFRIAAANILKEFDKEKIFLFFLKKKNKKIYSSKEFLDDSKLL